MVWKEHTKYRIKKKTITHSSLLPSSRYHYKKEKSMDHAVACSRLALSMEAEGTGPKLYFAS